MNKNITSKKRHLQTHSAVLPLPHGLVLRQEVLHPSIEELVSNAPFVVRTCVCCIPPCLDVCVHAQVRGSHFRFHNPGVYGLDSRCVQHCFLTASPRHLQG